MKLSRKEQRSLKQKDIVRLESLYAKHPADVTIEEQAEMEKLTTRRNIYG